MASRLFTTIREEHGLAYYVSSSQLPGLTPGTFFFYLGTSPEQLEFAETMLLKEIASIGKDGLTQEELDRAKKTYIGKQHIQMQSLSTLAQSASLDELYGLGYDHHESVAEKIEALTLDDIKTGGPENPR